MKNTFVDRKIVEGLMRAPGGFYLLLIIIRFKMMVGGGYEVELF